MTVIREPKSITPFSFFKIIGIFAIIIFGIIIITDATYVVQPGTRGVKIRLGTVTTDFLPEGFGFKAPFITRIEPVTVRQTTREITTECFSSDLQQVNMQLRILYKVPEASVVPIYRGYAGDPFDSLVVPRVEEALKEVVALQSAELVVRQREEIKRKTLEIARKKIGDLLDVQDIALVNINLSSSLEAAIEEKMVQEQEAAKSKFIQQKAEIEAKTAVIRAKGEADAIRVRAEALRANPEVIDLQIVEKWDGKTPAVLSTGGNTHGSSATNILLPINLNAKRGE